MISGIIALIEIYRGFLYFLETSWFAVFFLIVREEVMYHYWNLVEDTIETLLIIWMMLAAKALTVLIWECTGIITYQSSIVINDVISRGLHVFFCSKAVYVYTLSLTNKNLSPIILLAILNISAITLTQHYYSIVVILVCYMNLLCCIVGYYHFLNQFLDA